MTLDRAAIERILPHRHPMLFLDRVVELETGLRARAEHDVRADAFWVPGHFPSEAIFPGVLLAEALAQTAAVLVLAGREGAADAVYLLGYDDLRFRRAIRPGETLTLEAQLTGSRRRIYTFDVSARVGGERAADGKLLATGPA